MSCLTSTNRTKLEARKALLEANITALYTALTSGSTEVKEYRFDPNGASQRVQYRSLNEISSTIDILERRLDSIDRRLAGTGLTSLVLKRRGGHVFCR